MLVLSAHAQTSTISLRDSGIGISADELDKIFERFYRGDHSRSEGGCGLGLSLIKAVVTDHQGTVSVSSVQGQGTEFLVRLPSESYKSM